jgi:hypothetical protein
MISYIAISNSIGSMFPSGGSGGTQRIITEASDQIITEATSQNMITE